MPTTLDSLPTGPLGATAAVKLAFESRPVVPGYELGEPIGRGGMGVVFKATEKASGREVAIKWLTSRAREDLRLRFEREARAVSSVRHPNIVSVLGAGSSSEGSWIAMELVQGFSLGAALDAKALGKNALVDVVVKVAQALDAAHRAGVVHRDVKPENIIVDEKGEPRLLDFGLARFLEEKGALTAENSMLGTLGYMAPEVFEGGGAGAGPACDVYALGAILYEGLTGAPPYGRGTPSALIARMQRGSFEPLPASVPEELAAVCNRALERDPTKRLAASELAQELVALAPSPREARGGSGSGAEKEEAADGKPASEPERKLLFILVCVLGIGAGAIGTVFALRGDAPPAATTTETPPPPPAALPIMPLAPESDADALPVALPAAIDSTTAPKPEPVAEAAPTAPPSPPEPAPVADPTPAPAPAPAPTPAPVPPPAPAKPATLTAEEMRDLQKKIHEALQADERAKASEFARTAIARAPAGVDAFVAQAHVVLGRDALLDLKTAQAEREYARAILLDAKNKHALLGLVAVNLLEGSPQAAMKHLRSLESQGPSLPLQAAKALVATAKREQGFRFQLGAVQAEKVDPVLVKTVSKELMERDPERRK